MNFYQEEPLNEILTKAVSKFRSEKHKRLNEIRDLPRADLYKLRPRKKQGKSEEAAKEERFKVSVVKRGW